MKQPKVIIVYSPYQPFVLQCICAIIQEAEYTMAVIESGKPPEGEFDFLVIDAKEFNKEDELDCNLIFTSIGEAGGMIKELDYLTNLVKYMRSQKHAYCMDATEHPQGLHNYNNFRNFIMPLTFMFKKDGYDFTKINPSKLIEKLRPVEANEQKS